MASGEGDGTPPRAAARSDTARRIAELAKHIAELFAQATADDVRKRYAVGALLVSAASDRRAVPIKAIAALVGCSARALYQCVTVHRRFSEEELGHWLKQRSVHGHPPTWSHFVVLCTVTSRSRRHALLSAWLAHPSSVRSLANKARTSEHGRRYTNRVARHTKR